MYITVNQSALTASFIRTAYVGQKMDSTLAVTVEP